MGRQYEVIGNDVFWADLELGIALNELSGAELKKLGSLCIELSELSEDSRNAIFDDYDSEFYPDDEQNEESP